jgi:hypothetical protein
MNCSEDAGGKIVIGDPSRQGESISYLAGIVDRAHSSGMKPVYPELAAQIK